MAIEMTESAAQKIRALVAGKPARGLRVRGVKGGCSGLTYEMDLDAAREGDEIFERDGAALVVDQDSFQYLQGTELDYREDLMSGGFRLKNPNATRTCGCGTSFAT